MQKSIQVEVIVIEDGIFDNTQAVLKPFLDQIQLICLKQNRGAPYARNLGLTKCSSDYVMFLDADDFISDDLLFAAAETLHDEEADICFCPWQDACLEEKGPVIFPPRGSSQDIISNWLKFDDFTPPVAIVWRKQKLNEIGG